MIILIIWVREAVKMFLKNASIMAKNKLKTAANYTKWFLVVLALCELTSLSSLLTIGLYLQFELFKRYNSFFQLSEVSPYIYIKAIFAR